MIFWKRKIRGLEIEFPKGYSHSKPLINRLDEKNTEIIIHIRKD
jgi:hypothetical protein